MDDEKLERQPSEEDDAGKDELEAKELDEKELEKAAGGDPGYTHPDIPDVWPGG